MGKSSKSLSEEDIKHLAKLANLRLEGSEIEDLESKLSETIEYIDNLSEVRLEGGVKSHAEYGNQNVYRDDEIDSTRSLTQEEAVSQGSNTKKGQFVVDRVIEH